jgi:drug/metabolite transporter (DMT)-like permease
MTSRLLGPVTGAAAMICVGSSVAVSQHLTDAPLFTAQAIRYAAATVLLAIVARALGRRVPWPRGRDWLWLAGVAATGLVLFNVAIVRGVEHAEPAVIAVAVACVPVLLAILGPLLDGHRPTRMVLLAAVIVTVGGVLTEGAGRTDLVGAGWAVVALTCEAGFTLLAIPVLGRVGAWGVSLHATWIAAVMLGVLGVSVEGPAAVTRLTESHLLAMAHLTVVVTALAFVLWYSAVARLGAGPAGLLTGIAPVSAAVTAIAMGAAAPGLGVWAGIAVVGVGLAVGLLGSAGSQDVPAAARTADRSRELAVATSPSARLPYPSTKAESASGFAASQ